MAKKYIIGIDLGTTNSCVAIMEGRVAKVIPAEEGGLTIPSIVAYKENDIMVGEAAKRQAVTNPKNTLYSTKRFIGKSFTDCSTDISAVPYSVGEDGGRPVFKVLNDRMVRPEEAAARILEKMKNTALAYLGKDAEIEGAVITVPAYFNNTQKQATIDAGKIAGLEVKRIINEPTAAAVAYGIDKGEATKRVAVFDFGGGTFDISILEVGGGLIEVKATSGDNHLGGDDVDNVLINYIASEFKKDHGIDLKKDPMALQRIKEAAEKAKKELSSGVLSTEIVLPFITMTNDGPKHLNMSLSKNQFEDMIDSLLERLVKPCEEALSKSGFSKNEIDVVLAVGGSTRIPLARKKAEKIFGKELDKTVDPDTVVAQGAAIQAAILSGDSNVQDIALLDILPIALGIETEGGLFTPIIKEGTTIPTSNEETFTTAADNQSSVTIRLLQGASDIASRNQEIGRFDLSGIAPAPRGVPQIVVKFEVNSDGVLHCTARDTKTGNSQTLKILAKNGLNDEIISKLKEEAEKHREEDSKKKEVIQTKYEAQSIAKQALDNIETFKEKISEGLFNEIKTASEALKETAEKLETYEQVSAIKSEIDNLQKLLQKIGDAIYKQPEPCDVTAQSTGSSDSNSDQIV